MGWSQKGARGRVLDDAPPWRDGGKSRGKRPKGKGKLPTDIPAQKTGKGKGRPVDDPACVYCVNYDTCRGKCWIGQHIPLRCRYCQAPFPLPNGVQAHHDRGILLDNSSQSRESSRGRPAPRRPAPRSAATRGATDSDEDTKYSKFLQALEAKGFDQSLIQESAKEAGYAPVVKPKVTTESSDSWVQYNKANNLISQHNNDLKQSNAKFQKQLSELEATQAKIESLEIKVADLTAEADRHLQLHWTSIGQEKVIKSRIHDAKIEAESAYEYCSTVLDGNGVDDNTKNAILSCIENPTAQIQPVLQGSTTPPCVPSGRGNGKRKSDQQPDDDRLDVDNEFPPEWDCEEVYSDNGRGTAGLSSFGPASPTGCRSPKGAAEPYIVNAAVFPLPSKETLSKREKQLRSFAAARQH
jgi:hypothetical protein